VANSRDNTVSVIDIKTDKVVRTISVGREPAFVVIDPNMHKLYSTANFVKSRRKIPLGIMNLITPSLILLCLGMSSVYPI
jgi:YVTN family beta-propeller protein